MALTALNLTDPKYAWVIRPVEVGEVCIGGRSCMTRGGGSYSGTSLRDPCCVFAVGRCSWGSSVIFPVGMAMCTGAMLSDHSLAVCVCRLTRRYFLKLVMLTYSPVIIFSSMNLRER